MKIEIKHDETLTTGELSLSINGEEVSTGDKSRVMKKLNGILEAWF